MNIRSIRWRDVVPWTLLGIVLSCGGAAIAPATSTSPASGGAAAIARSLDVDEIVLRGKDGTVRGKLTGDSLTLSDAAGNKLEIALGAASKVALTSAAGFSVALAADDKTAMVTVFQDDRTGMLAIDKESTTMSIGAGGRTISAGVETARPLADIEMFDANGKRRASFGLNSNGDPRVSLYDAAENRRLYGILTEDVAVLDLNDKTGASAVQLLGADPKLGSGMTVTQGTKTSRIGLGTDGKPLKELH
jgi:hypothetical protein